jgi:hypothetical protein
MSKFLCLAFSRRGGQSGDGERGAAGKRCCQGRVNRLPSLEA